MDSWTKRLKWWRELQANLGEWSRATPRYVPDNNKDQGTIIHHLLVAQIRSGTPILERVRLVRSSISRILIHVRDRRRMAHALALHFAGSMLLALIGRFVLLGDQPITPDWRTLDALASTSGFLLSVLTVWSAKRYHFNDWLNMETTRIFPWVHQVLSCGSRLQVQIPLGFPIAGCAQDIVASHREAIRNGVDPWPRAHEILENERDSWDEVALQRTNTWTDLMPIVDLCGFGLSAMLIVLVPVLQKI